MTEQAMQHVREADVTIVGAGPVGLSTANLLGLRGVSVNIVETLTAIIDYPRGVGIDDESLRSLQTMGLIEKALPFTTPNHIMRLVNGRGSLITEIAPSIDEFGWSRRNAFIQPAVDRVLLEGLDRFEHTAVHFGHDMTGFTETANSVEVSATAPDGQSVQFRSRYLVGADGGRSKTRKLTGVSFEGQSPSTRWLVIDVENDPLGVPNVWVGGDPRRPYVSLALPNALRRFEFMLFDDEPDEFIEREDFVTGLLAPHVPDPRRLEIIRRRVYTHHSRIAGTFRRGRVFLAGDAAHLMPVWQGQGWNSGMRDATNLAWKLADVATGRCGDALLDSYSVERQPHAKAMIDISVAFGRMVKPTNHLLSSVRDIAAKTLNVVPSIKAYFSQMKYKPMPRYRAGVVVDTVNFTPRSARPEIVSKLQVYRAATNRTSPVGTQFIQPRVRDEQGDVRLLDDVIGYRWAVLRWGGDPVDYLDKSDLAILERLDAILVSLRPVVQAPATLTVDPLRRIVGDETGALKRWFDTRATAMLVLRPDRFIASAGLAQDTSRALRAVAQAAALNVSDVASESAEVRS